MINTFWDSQERFVIPIWLKESKILLGESYLGSFNLEKTECEIGYFLFEEFFQNRTCYLLKEKGIILFNTMCLSEKENLRSIRMDT
ncbi:MAG: hypothetical protein EOO85_29930, partial [Pedobacter sp.]